MLDACGCPASAIVGQTSSNPHRITNPPPIISLADNVSPAKIAAVSAPNITSGIKRIPTRAGSSRRVAHISQAIDTPHHPPPVAKTLIPMRAASAAAIVGRGLRNGAKANAVTFAPRANMNVAGSGDRWDFRRIHAVSPAQTSSPMKAIHSPRLRGTGKPPSLPSMINSPASPTAIAISRSVGTCQRRTNFAISTLQTRLKN